MGWLKKIQGWIEFALIIFLLYNFFPSANNAIVWFFKFCFMIVVVYSIVYWTNFILTKIRYYIEDNYVSWIRKQYEGRRDIKYSIYGTNVLANIFIFFNNLFLRRKRIISKIIYLSKENKVETGIIIVFVITFIYILYIFL